MTGRVHIIGAGLAGLSAATELADSGCSVVLYEAASAPGGRCRSFHDRQTGLTIDNGNHLLLSGNRAALDYLRRIGTEHLLAGPAEASFPFVDARTRERWVLRPNRGRFPWWLASSSRRVPGSSPLEYFGILRLFAKPRYDPVGPTLGDNAVLDERLWRPVLLAALNTAPEEAAAGLAARIVRETLAAGGATCRPLVATKGLSATFIDPAIRFLRAHGAEFRRGSRLSALECASGMVSALVFDGSTVPVTAGDRVVLAVPPWTAAELLPGLVTPRQFRAILNLHYAIVPPVAQPLLLGIVNATAQWLFAFPDRLSVTVSDADDLMSRPADELAVCIWNEISTLLDLPSEVPPFRVVKEKRATFAATPEEARRRPPAKTAYTNLMLAGDWVDTGLPATIEGAIRSGNAAARAIVPMRLRTRRPATQLKEGVIAAG